MTERIDNGRAAAIGVTRHPARIGLVDFNEAAATQTARMIESDGGACIVVQADVTDAKSCEAAVETTVERWGRLGILANNAGTIGRRFSQAVRPDRELISTGP